MPSVLIFWDYQRASLVVATLAARSLVGMRELVLACMPITFDTRDCLLESNMAD